MSELREWTTASEIEEYDDARLELSEDGKVSCTKLYIKSEADKIWKVGCFYGTGEELINKAFSDSELSGKCYEAAVRYVEALEKIQAENY